MKECLIIMSKSESYWTGSVEKFESPWGGESLFSFSSVSPFLVMREIRSFLSRNKELMVVRMIRNGNPRLLGYYARSLNMKTG